MDLRKEIGWTLQTTRNHNLALAILYSTPCTEGNDPTKYTKHDFQKSASFCWIILVHFEYFNVIVFGHRPPVSLNEQKLVFHSEACRKGWTMLHQKWEREIIPVWSLLSCRLVIARIMSHQLPF